MLADLKLECLSGSARIHPVRTYPVFVFARFHLDSGVMARLIVCFSGDNCRREKMRRDKQLDREKWGLSILLRQLTSSYSSHSYLPAELGCAVLCCAWVRTNRAGMPLWARLRHSLGLC